MRSCHFSTREWQDTPSKGSRRRRSFCSFAPAGGHATIYICETVSARVHDRGAAPASPEDLKEHAPNRRPNNGSCDDALYLMVERHLLREAVGHGLLLFQVYVQEPPELDLVEHPLGSGTCGQHFDKLGVPRIPNFLARQAGIDVAPQPIEIWANHFSDRGSGRRYRTLPMTAELFSLFCWWKRQFGLDSRGGKAGSQLVALPPAPPKHPTRSDRMCSPGILSKQMKC